MSALAAIHIKRKQLGIEDDDFRDVVLRMTGQHSTKALKPQQSAALLGELDRLSGGRLAASNRPSNGRRKKLEGPYVKKIQALWISMWNLGLVTDRDDKALAAFVKRQTGLAHPNWMKDPFDAQSVIEAMKKWMERERGVYWALEEGNIYFPDHQRLPGYKIACAQWPLVDNLEPYAGYTLASYVQFLVGKSFKDMKPVDWIAVMNTIGESIRRDMKKGGK